MEMAGGHSQQIAEQGGVGRFVSDPGHEDQAGAARQLAGDAEPAQKAHQVEGCFDALGLGAIELGAEAASIEAGPITWNRQRVRRQSDGCSDQVVLVRAERVAGEGKECIGELGVAGAWSECN